VPAFQGLAIVFATCDTIGTVVAFVVRRTSPWRPAVLRITASNGSATTTLKLEGKLNRHSVSEFAKSCLPHLEEPGNLLLDFSSLAFVDDAGVKVVRDLIRRNVRIRGCSPLVANLLKETQD
jgi:anti-anti-sigma regulatory factor